jgi:precorrin isomerase
VARLAVKSLRDVFEVITVDAHIINQAIDSKFADVEDAIQHARAMRTGASHLITRDAAGFRHAEMAVVAPDAYLSARSG